MGCNVVVSQLCVESFVAKLIWCKKKKLSQLEKFSFRCSNCPFLLICIVVKFRSFDKEMEENN